MEMKKQSLSPVASLFSSHLSLMYSYKFVYPVTGKVTITKDENGNEKIEISDIQINKPGEEGGNSGDNQGKTEQL